MILHIYYQKNHVGNLNYQRKTDSLSLTYTDSWKESADHFPISLSLPIHAKTHNNDTLRNFINGLLPDNPAILDSWGKRFHVSPRNPFDLLQHVGEDCAGALQFIQTDRLDSLLTDKEDKLTPLSDSDLEQIFIDLKKVEHAIPVFEDEGRFSLAGAQSKTALHYNYKTSKWNRPSGNIPTTHILKPQLEDFEHHGLNEHTCLTLAAEFGLHIPSSELLSIGEQTIICVTRYDRKLQPDGSVTRIHQEDFCQALAVEPQNKYQSQGGPSPSQIINLLRNHSDNANQDIGSFIRALAFNWMIMGTDAHAKNYSLLHAPGGYLQLAPIYDLSSFLPYRDPKSHKTKMAMKYGNTYHFHKIDRHHWKNFANESKLKEDFVIEQVASYLELHLNQGIENAYNKLSQNHPSPFLDQLIEQIQQNAQHCLDSLAE